MLFDYLTYHGITNVWCTPRQDMQVIMEPARLTPLYGVKGDFKLMWRTVPLPDTLNRWHVYQIGGTHPLAFNMFPRCYSWVRIAECCNKRSMIANLYTNTGYNIPLYNSYYSYTADHNLIIAVMCDPRYPFDIEKETLYFRVYSNAYYNSPRSDALVKNVQVYGADIETAADRAELKARYDELKELPGHVAIFSNCVRYDKWDDHTIAAIGKSVEIVYDAAIKKIVRLPIADLLNFKSTLDDKLKYVLHYAGPDDGTIDYFDDIDIYIDSNAEDSDGNSAGVYYNRNREDSMRQLTHRDYSIVATYVKRYAETQTEIAFAENPDLPPTFTLDPLNLFVTMYIRHSGYERPLVFVNNRIHELYKMKDLDIQRAMVGIDAVVDIWRAENLEKSAYVELMGKRNCCDIDTELVQNAYGYNGISVVLANTPAKPKDVNGSMGVFVPYRCQYGCTAYEYGEDGLLLGYYHHYVGNYYLVQNPECAYVELIAGFGGKVLDEYKDATEQELSDKYTYKVYECTKIAGVPDNKFKDITYTDRHELTKTKYKKLKGEFTSYTVLRSDKRFIARDYEQSIVDGVLRVTLLQQIFTGSDYEDAPMTIPMGQMDVFLNGRSLIHGLDYFVDFPYVYITNKKYLIRPISYKKQNIHIRFMGHPSPDLEITSDGDVGFIEHGFLSNNSKYDIRDDKVLRIVVDGQLYTRDELEFSEFTSGVSVVDAMNGLPYMVKDILVPVAAFTIEDTYSLREKSMKIDKEVSDYLTLKIPQPDRPAPSAVPYRHQLYSPFVNKLIMDLVYDRLHLPSQEEGYSRQQVLDICKPYEYLLKVDPVSSEYALDDRYVVIHPHGWDHVIDLVKPKYQFVRQAINYFCNGRVELSGMVRLIEE